jgi:hypothetical protein
MVSLSLNYSPFTLLEVVSLGIVGKVQSGGSGLLIYMPRFHVFALLKEIRFNCFASL